ncbi:MAG: class I SAM-dependent methyltransferase [Anaerolineales bacterium]|jgi:SAM-dependent methyltransferase
MNNPDHFEETIAYYNQNADHFYASSVDLDITHLAGPLLPHLKPGDKILDAGCGSGRDSLYFLQHGFQVTAFDASIEMVRFARKLTGLNVLHTTFLEFHVPITFDAIWACASLLHVPATQIIDTIAHLSEFLRAGGIFYLSFKYGEKEEIRHGRLFSDYTEESLARMVSRLADLTVFSDWITTDIRPDRSTQTWINALLKKKDQNLPSIPTSGSTP